MDRFGSTARNFRMRSQNGEDWTVYFLNKSIERVQPSAWRAVYLPDGYSSSFGCELPRRSSASICRHKKILVPYKLSALNHISVYIDTSLGLTDLTPILYQLYSAKITKASRLSAILARSVSLRPENFTQEGENGLQHMIIIA